MNKRPAVPEWLPAAAADIWNAVVEAEADDYFPRESHEMLGMYCTHMLEWLRLTESVEQERLRGATPAGDGEPVGVDYRLLAALSTMRDRERRCVADLATKLRITLQSHYDPQKAKGKGASGQGGPKPHEQ